VTLLGEWGSQVALGATRERRDYVDRAAYDLLGLSLGETRSDTRWQLSLGARKTFWLDRSWPTEIVVDLNLSRRDVDSNDPYYDATSHVFTTGVQLGF
jgi:hypothetical protein